MATKNAPLVDDTSRAHTATIEGGIAMSGRMVAIDEFEINDVTASLLFLAEVLGPDASGNDLHLSAEARDGLKCFLMHTYESASSGRWMELELADRERENRGHTQAEAAKVA